MQVLDDVDLRELSAMRFHWEAAYQILWHGGRGEFTATRLSDESEIVLTDTTLEGLRGQVREDYPKWAPERVRMST